jgi:pyruvate kinase
LLRRTKIIATVGPATDDPAELKRVVAAGMDLARVNFSHGTTEQHALRIREIRDVAASCNRYVGIMVDLQGPKIRIENFEEGRVALIEGSPFVLDTALGAQAGTAERVGVTYKRLTADIKTGDTLLLDDGNIVLRVEYVFPTEIQCRVMTGGVLSNGKGLNRLGGGLSAEALTKKDREDIREAARQNADYVAVSFIRSAEDVNQARELLRQAGGQGHIVAKVERPEAIQNIEEIIRAADAVMIARGDLGVEIGDAELPGIQKRIAQLARQYGRVVITATQMMQSMVESPQPTRAEVLDVANAVMDGSDAVMLSAETAVGRHPHKVVEAMDRICRGAERQRFILPTNPRFDASFEHTEEAIALSAMYCATHANVGAIVAMTESGATARWMSRISSGIPIFALSRQTHALRRVTLYRGVYPLHLDPALDAALAEASAVEILQRLGVVKTGDSVIITKGDRHGVAGGTNALKIVQV